MSIRIQRKRMLGWRKPEGAVNVTRGSDWGNPFKVGDWVTSNGYVFRVTPAIAVSLFEALVDSLGSGIYEQIREELRGKDLMCFCRLDQPCHADVLLQIANEGA